MLDNFKAFIRHGRQGNNETAAATTATTTTTVTPAKEDYRTVAHRLVELEERLADPYPELVDYQLIRKMGEGAFSKVYAAQDLKNERDCAIKIINKTQMDNKQRQAVLKEVLLMRQLDHPNVVAYYGFIDGPNYYYIIQELVPGGEIFSPIVKLTYFLESLSRHVIVQVANAVRYLHEEVGIVHRDIKPENLLYTPVAFRPLLNPIAQLRKSDDPTTKVDEGEFLPGIGGGGIGVVKLADFGLSKQVWYANTGTPCGTVGYTAPEIVKDEKYSKEVDMWALGCVLYTLLCGFPPFYDERIDQLTHKVLRGEYEFLAPWWDEISTEAKTCVGRLLTVDKAKRYTIEQFLNDPWVRAGGAVQQDGFAVPKPKAARASVPHNSEPLMTPQARAMRDAFDISVAYHRAQEEDTVMEQVLEEEPEELVVEQQQVAPAGFDLNLGGASILSRRKRVGV